MKQTAGLSLRKRQRPFMAQMKRTGWMENSLEMNPVDAAQVLSHLPLNLVFDLYKDFEFQGSLGDVKISEMFSHYYTQCIAMAYDPDNVARFL
ncbi:hypothetical protein BGZ98_006902 [Dissophora globulifera]|nr:hypothetical protein BGZ98_006902 [Dissophora globulifera]